MWTIAGWSSIACAASVEKQIEMTNHMNNSRSRPAPRRLILESIVDIYEQMEQCENSVLADRLAILANICDLPYRLESTKLNHSQYGYSTCLLVLIFANIWPDREKRRMRYKELPNDLMDVPIGILLSYLAWQVSVDGPDSEICTERYAYEPYIEKYHGHRADLDRVRGFYKAQPRTVSRRVSFESMSSPSAYDSRHPDIVYTYHPVDSVDLTSESSSAYASSDECSTSAPLSRSENEMLERWLRRRRLQGSVKRTLWDAHCMLLATRSLQQSPSHCFHEEITQLLVSTHSND